MTEHNGHPGSKVKAGMRKRCDFKYVEYSNGKRRNVFARCTVEDADLRRKVRSMKRG